VLNAAGLAASQVGEKKEGGSGWFLQSQVQLQKKCKPAWASFTQISGHAIGSLTALRLLSNGCRD
jgi:hypothetical protein